MPQIIELREYDGGLWARVEFPGEFPEGVTLWSAKEVLAHERMVTEAERKRCADVVKDWIRISSECGPDTLAALAAVLDQIERGE